MNKTSYSLDDVAASDSLTPAEALVQCDWIDGIDGNVLELATDRGTAELHPLGSLAGWQRFTLHGPMISLPAKDDVLAANKTLPIPAKFIAVGNENVSCCSDIPEEWLDMRPMQFEFNAEPVTTNPCLSWAKSVTDFVRDAAAHEMTHTQPRDIVGALARSGWSASLDEEQIHVHIHLANVYRKVRVVLEPTGFRVTADMLEIQSLAAESKQAITLLAGEANRRLPLVRYAVLPQQAKSLLQAEVALNVSLIPGAWLFAALHAVEAAIALTASELEALRDPELADWYLAARAT